MIFFTTLQFISATQFTCINIHLVLNPFDFYTINIENVSTGLITNLVSGINEKGDLVRLETTKMVSKELCISRSCRIVASIINKKQIEYLNINQIMKFDFSCGSRCLIEVIPSFDLSLSNTRDIDNYIEILSRKRYSTYRDNKTCECETCVPSLKYQRN